MSEYNMPDSCTNGEEAGKYPGVRAYTPISQGCTHPNEGYCCTERLWGQSTFCKQHHFEVTERAYNAAVADCDFECADSYLADFASHGISKQPLTAAPAKAA